jgi:hypothetical protein
MVWGLILADILRPGSCVPCVGQVWSALESLPAPEKLSAAGHLQQRELARHTAALQKLEVAPPQLAQAAVAKLVLQVRIQGHARTQEWEGHGALVPVLSAIMHSGRGSCWQ